MLPIWEFDGVYFMYILMFFVFVYMIKNSYFKGSIRAFFIEVIKQKKLILIVFVIIALIIFTLDKSVSIYFKNNFIEDGTLNKIATFGNNLGNGKYLYSFLIFFGMIALIINEKSVRIFYISFASGIFTGVLNQILKILIVRQRPYESYNPFLIFAHKKAILEGKYITHIYDSTYYSMPSGHTITLTGIFLVFALHIKNKFLKAIFFLIPLTTAFGRVYVQKHWLSDVIFAYLIGYIVAKTIYNLNKNKLR